MALGTALRRLISDLLLEPGAGEHPSPRRVHQIRVGLKRFRALLRLAHPKLPPARFQRIDRLAADLKRTFAFRRDRDVAAKLIRKTFPRREADAILARLELNRAAPSLAVEIAKACKLARQLAKTLESKPFPELKPGAIRRARKKSLRSAKTWMRRCARSSADDEVFHAWRKRVKTLLYQCDHINGDKTAKRPRKRLASLAEALGLHHDLAILGRILGEIADPPIAKATLARIVRQKERAAKRALDLGPKALDLSLFD